VKPWILSGKVGKLLGPRTLDAFRAAVDNQQIQNDLPCLDRIESAQETWPSHSFRAKREGRFDPDRSDAASEGRDGVENSGSHGCFRVGGNNGRLQNRVARAML
jgi:hypothetical protein